MSKLSPKDEPGQKVHNCACVHQTHGENQKLLDVHGAEQGAGLTVISIQPSADRINREKDKTGRICAAARLMTASEYQHARTHCLYLTLPLVQTAATFPTRGEYEVCHDSVKAIGAQEQQLFIFFPTCPIPAFFVHFQTFRSSVGNGEDFSAP